MQPSLSLAGVWLELTQFHRTRLPVLRWISMCIHAVATTPAGPLDDVARLVQRCQSSPMCWRVDSCIAYFEACSAFTHVTACVLAKSPKVTPLHRSASAEFVTSFHRSDCYRLERQVVGWESHPLKIHAFHGAQHDCTLRNVSARLATTETPTFGAS